MAQQLTEAVTAPERRSRMTYEEYLTQVDEDAHAEWVDGEVVRFMPPTARHQDVVGVLLSLLSIYARLRGLGRVFVAPFEMHVSDRSSREPDVLFVATEHADRLTPERLDGPADLVIEVISNDSVGRDRGDKFYEYQEARVPEYWLFDPRSGKERTDVYRLTAGGIYQAVLPDTEGRFHATVVPGFWIDPRWVQEDPLPDALTLLRRMAPGVAQQALAGNDAAAGSI
jgi:Uma2 family endonuclease